MFPNLKQAGKKPVLNAGTELGPGRGCSRMLGTGNFPDFFGKNLVAGKWHSGTQTSTLAGLFLLSDIGLKFSSYRLLFPNILFEF